MTKNRLKSPFMIVPKDKRVLKSSKVRAYYKTLNDILEPKKQKMMDAANKATTDAMIYGTGWLEYDYNE